MCLILLQLSVKVARAALSRGVYPAREVSAQGDPWPGWEGSDSGSGRQEVRAGPADQRGLGRLHREVGVRRVPREGQRQQKGGVGGPEGGGIGEGPSQGWTEASEERPWAGAASQAGRPQGGGGGRAASPWAGGLSGPVPAGSDSVGLLERRGRRPVYFCGAPKSGSS